MMKTKIAIFFLFCGIAINLFPGDYSVGKILSFSGDVVIDHFGNGSYIKAREGESVYKNSIIKTGARSSATVAILELTKEIPPFSEFSVAPVIALESRKKNTGWFRSLMNLINQASDAFFEGEENVDLASRGEDDVLGKDTLFAYETEEDLRPDYWQELDLFLEMGAGDTREYSAGEIELKKGLCYFGLAQYRDALEHLGVSSDMIKKEDEPFFFDNLILMLGVTHYVLAEYPASTDYFTHFLSRNNVPEYNPFAYWLLLDSLLLSGKEEEAKILMEKAEESLRGSILEDKFRVFLEEMSINDQPGS
jgi:tetratricopeptide (TPR) repeat protein